MLLHQLSKNSCVASCKRSKPCELPSGCFPQQPCWAASPGGPQYTRDNGSARPNRIAGQWQIARYRHRHCNAPTSRWSPCSDKEQYASNCRTTFALRSRSAEWPLVSPQLPRQRPDQDEWSTASQLPRRMEACSCRNQLSHTMLLAPYRGSCWCAPGALLRPLTEAPSGAQENGAASFQRTRPKYNPGSNWMGPDTQGCPIY
jgi:hypothetical protein